MWAAPSAVTVGRTANTDGDSKAAINWASQARSLGVHDFTVSRTSLEDIYLALTGRNQGTDDFTDRS